MKPTSGRSYTLALLLVLSTPLVAQQKPERFWLAGRYDGNRIVVYFDAVKFAGGLTAKALKIAPPVAEAFFDPVELPAGYIASFQNIPGAEHFALGDLYDLIVGNGSITTVKLTTLIGCETDEEVGNDSFIGALATVTSGRLPSGGNYYAVRRHHSRIADPRALLTNPFASMWKRRSPGFSTSA
jgi:hypothetical protein